MSAGRQTEGRRPARWWSKQADGRLLCELCPRACTLRPGQQGFCVVREAGPDGMTLNSYGRSSGFCLDPIEKKPLNHFLPGTSVLSFGTVGCNLGCQFCQNWDISKVREQERLLDHAAPEQIARYAAYHGARSVACTYNDPVIFAEYAMDVAEACRQRGLASVAVSAGYISPTARAEFFDSFDAANIDLKGFSETFYRQYSLAALHPVLDTLGHIAHGGKTWLEITTLLIPGLNDSDSELQQMTAWIERNLGREIPLHFTAFHPDFKMRDFPPTPLATLRRARRIAIDQGLRFVYTGNVSDFEGDATCCPQCASTVIQRDRYRILSYRILDGACNSCGCKIPGRFENKAGDWGARRLPVLIGS
ncbi:MAG: AmmeMemoRadiSam system radical SAM enzyme [Leptospirales bacterium]|nr:AmmeMemoRadiSam system radical SAM enzyme [Leptospirales bacterium]